MSDIFISYASEDRDRAAKLATAFGAMGWSVWWDRKILAGQAFDHAIERELESAKSVVVLWSTHSIASEWVKNEAAVAAERGVLVPAKIDDVKLPLEFRRKQTADLTDWDEDSSHGGFQALCEGVAAAMGSEPTAQRPLPHSAPKSERRSRWIAGTLATVAGLGLGIYVLDRWHSATPLPHSGGEAGTGNVRKSAGSEEPPAATAGLADLVVGSYAGAVISDSKGSSRSDIDVDIAKIDRLTVRVTSTYPRVGTVDVALTRIGNKIFNADGHTPFIVDLDQNPPTLTVNPRNELAYSGRKRE